MPSNHRRLVFLRPDGGVSVDVPVARIFKTPERLAAHIAKLLAQPEQIGWTYQAEVHMENLPAGRKLRNAWRWNGVVFIDVPAGRAELLRQLREERDDKLKATDALAMRDMERGAPDPGLGDYRQALRDLPASATTELAAITTAQGLEDWAPAWPSEPIG